MTDNPYAAPQSEVRDPAMTTEGGEFRTDPTAFPAGHGVKWLADGWRLFTRDPVAWLTITFVRGLIAMAFALVGMKIPLLPSLVSMMLEPVFNGGLMAGCDRSSNRRGIEIGDLFGAFGSDRFGPLALVGVLFLAFYIVLVILFGIVVAVAAMAAKLNGFALTSLDATTIGLLFAIAVLLGIGLTLPAIMAAWFAPALIAINGLPTIEACKVSFRGCLANWLPYLIFGLVGVGITVLVAVPYLALLALGQPVAAVVVGGIIALPFAFIAGPVYTASIYSAYRDIYYRA